MCSWIWFLNIFWECLHVYSSGILVYSFFVLSFSVYLINVMPPVMYEFGSVPSSSIFWKSLRRMDVNPCLNAWLSHQWSHHLSGPGVFCVGSCLITDSTFLLIIGLFIFSVSSWFKFGRLCVSRNASISPRLCNFLAYNCS